MKFQEALKCVGMMALRRKEQTLETLIYDLSKSQKEWSEKTFGSDGVRGPEGALKHLQREAEEAIKAIGTEAIIEELADCLILLIDASRRAGIHFEALAVAAVAKHCVNLTRKWPEVKADENEPVEHIRGAGE